MGRSVQHDGKGQLEVRFPYDRDLVDTVKSLPRRRWNAAQRLWTVPESDVVELVDLLVDLTFQFDEATQKLYAGLGGERTLGAASSPTGTAASGGLFDDLPPAPASPTSPAVSPQDQQLSVSELNTRVKAVLSSAFPEPIWVVGEISSFNKGAHRRHVSFQLVELDPTGRSVSQIGATLFESTRSEIDRQLDAAGQPFKLEDEITVRMLVRVELYVPWGSYRVIVEGLDLNYTLGEAARRREEILRALAADGLLEKNRELPLAALPLRVGLITSLGSDGCKDVLHTLQESGFSFDVTVHGARVQGRQTVPSVLNALDYFAERADRFDVVLLCRGGGSRTDLAWFDSEPLGRAIAHYPLPVISGIGHEQDQSVPDGVARRAKTPTAAAGLLVERVREALLRVETAQEQILRNASESIQREQQDARDRIRRLIIAANSTIQSELHTLSRRQRTTVDLSQHHLSRSREQLVRHVSLLPARVRSRLQSAQLDLKSGLARLDRASRVLLDAERKAIRAQAEHLTPHAARHMALQRERLETRANRLENLSPQRVLERGYSIVRDETGRIVLDAKKIDVGAELTTHLQKGRLSVRVERTES